MSIGDKFTIIKQSKSGKEKIMNKKIRTVIITLILFYTCPAGATVWTEGYHQINIGEVYGEVWIQNDVKLDIFGGDISQLGALNNTITNWYDGEMGYLLSRDNSIVNIYGGSLNFLVPDENSQINLHAYDVTYNDLTHIIEGNYYKDNSHFGFKVFPDLNGYSHIVVVPEPSTLILLGLGGFFIRKRKNLKQ
jgi:hypothetical protein